MRGLGVACDAPAVKLNKFALGTLSIPLSMYASGLPGGNAPIPRLVGLTALIGTWGLRSRCTGKQCHPFPSPDPLQTHTKAKELSPEGSYIWRSHGSGSWCGRIPPNRERSRSWAKWGERRACIIILQGLWQEWADLKGQTIEPCLVLGLFDEDGAGVLTDVVDVGAASSSTARGGGAAGAEAVESQQGDGHPASSRGRAARRRPVAKAGAKA